MSRDKRIGLLRVFLLYTWPGLVLLTILGVGMWLTLPVWITAAACIILYDRVTR